MLTHCPSCRTTFRVTPVQIKARSGKVRCGQCHFVFNAIDSLADEVVIARPALLPSDEVLNHPPEPDLPEESLMLETAEASTAIDDAAAIPEFEEVPQTTTLASVSEEFDEEVDLADTTDEESDASLGSETVDPLFPDLLLHEEPAPGKRWPWLVGSAIAILLLLAQMIYLYRIELAVLRPDWRPLLLSACRPLKCEVPRPRHADTLSIDASDLHPDAQLPGRLTLTATLRSRAPFAQEWPDLELTLNDVIDRKLAIRDFHAADYLPKGTDIKAGFPANGEVTVILPLDVGDVSAAGYRLYIFYP
jgi:predicted Zn finger-like uncharacterized protein